MESKKGKNSLDKLNDHLFEQLEKISDEKLTGGALEEALKRSDAVANLSEKIIKNGELQLKAIKYIYESGIEEEFVPQMLEVKNE